MKHFKAWMIMGALWMAATGWSQVDPSRVVMVINGEEIKGSEYYKRMEYLPNVGRQINGEFVVDMPGVLALQRLIDERVILSLAADKGVLPTKAEIDEFLTERQTEDPKFIETWATGGLTREDLEYQVKVELAQFKLQTQGITITDVEVEKHYNENPTRFTIRKKYTLRLIAVPEEKKAAVDTALKSGKSFADVAKEMSSDMTHLDGGMLGDIELDYFADPVKNIVAATKIGQASDWIKGETQSVRFYVEAIKPETKIPLDAKLKKTLRKSLMLDRGVTKNNLPAMLLEQRKKMKVDYRQVQFKDEFQRWLEGYKLGK